MAKGPVFEETAVLSGHEKAVVSVKFKPGDGSLVASASADASAKIWSPQRSECVSTLRGHAQGICDVAWNSAGTYICTASDDHTLKLWVRAWRRMGAHGAAWACPRANKQLPNCILRGFLTH